MSVFGLLPYALEATPGRGLALLFLGMVLLCAVGVYGGISDANRSQDRYERAVSIWLSECRKPVEACAYDWDRSYTLRSIYAKRAREE